MLPYFLRDIKNLGLQVCAFYPTKILANMRKLLYKIRAAYIYKTDKENRSQKAQNYVYVLPDTKFCIFLPVFE